jgi:hypothetical protein
MSDRASIVGFNEPFNKKSPAQTQRGGIVATAAPAPAATVASALQPKEIYDDRWLLVNLESFQKRNRLLLQQQQQVECAR